MICTLGTTYELELPTLTSDRVCVPVKNCRVGHVIILAPTLTSNRVCSAGAAEKIFHHQESSGSEIVGIVVGVVLFGVALFVIGRRLGAKDKARVEEAEMQLLSARTESAESQETVRRILSAWEILSDDITLLKRLAEGVCAAPPP
jgi:hypothetical protein